MIIVCHSNINLKVIDKFYDNTGSAKFLKYVMFM